MGGTLVEGVPEELRGMRRWLCCDEGSKRPVRPSDGRAASVSKPEDWGTFEEAASLVGSGFCDYLGFVFADDGLVGIDVDHAFGEDGMLSTEAAEVVRACASYAEVSKSGNGIHIICRGEIPFKGRNAGGWEMYRDGRWFVLTGRRIGPWGVSDGAEGIELALGRHFPDAPAQGSGTGSGELVWEPSWPPVEGRRVPVAPRYPTVRSGARHISLVSFCGRLWTRGCPPEALSRLARRENARSLEPPLPEDEVERIVQSIRRYAR